jgi:hypothetical protein
MSTCTPSLFFILCSIVSFIALVAGQCSSPYYGPIGTSPFVYDLIIGPSGTLGVLSFSVNKNTGGVTGTYQLNGASASAIVGQFNNVSGQLDFNNIGSVITPGSNQVREWLW